MFSNVGTGYLVIALGALLPGTFSWWSARRLMRRLDDPALPELLAAHRRRNGAAGVVAMVGLGCVSVWTSSSLLPLIIGGLILSAGIISAGYPLRRALHNETWSFVSYFCFYPRLAFAFFGFWIVLGTLPTLATGAGRWDWLVGGALAAVLVVWNIHYADFLRQCLCTRPLPEGVLLSQCRALADACGVPQPRFERIDLKGGVIANALALPSLRTSSVLFTDTMLDRFDQRELLGICAHELAHFEHYNPAYLRQLNLVTCSLIALGAAGPTCLRIVGLHWGFPADLLWLAVLLWALAMRGRDKQRQETTCDLRALELTADADALVSGLTKLHTVARLPRRMQNERESASTHPSLARRIRDIRKAAGAEPAALGAAHSFTSPDGGTGVTFDETGLRWIEPDGVTHSVTYAHLTELRLDPGRNRPRLIARGVGSRRWAMSLADSDVARLQAVLDVVDDRLADPPPPPTIPAGIQRAAVMMAAMVFLTFSQVALAFIALLTWAKPSLPLLVGAGLAALSAAGLVLRDHDNVTYVISLALPIAVIGLMFLAFAWTRRHDDPDQSIRPVLTLLALVAVAVLATVAMNGVDMVRLHRGTRATPSATVFLVALSAALTCSRARYRRLAGTATGVVALATLVLASTGFLDRFGTDPFLVGSPVLTRVAVVPDAAGEFAVASNTSRVDLSPDRRYVAARLDDTDYDDEHEEHPSIFQVARIGDPPTSIQADDVAFVDDGQLLVVEEQSGNTTVKTLRLDSLQVVVWQLGIADLTAPSLSFDRVTRHWRVIGWSPDRAIVRVQGSIGGSDIQRKRWPVAETRGSYVSALTTVGDDALVVETRYERPPLDRLIPWQWTWARGLVRGYSPVSRYSLLSDRGHHRLGESRLDVNCLADVLVNAGLVCTAYDGTRTRIVTIDAATGRVDGIAFLEGQFMSDQNAVRGWLTGWAGSRPVAIRLSTREVLHVDDRAALLSIAGDRLAALTFLHDRLTVRLYPLPPDLQAAGVALR